MDDLLHLVLEATGETLYMILVSTFFTILFGLPLALILYTTGQSGLNPKPKLYAVLDVIVNITRSFPFIILMIVLLPLSKLIVGTKIGTSASIVPLTVGAIPFLARLFEQEFLNVDRGIIEASKSMGASNFNILTRVLIPESLPQLVLAITNLMITLIGYSAMAGTIGGGGLGALAKRYGYDRFNTEVLLWAVVVIIILVEIVQISGTKISNKLNKKKHLGVVKMKKKILLVVLALALVLTSCAKKESKKEDGQKVNTDNKKVVIGVSPAPHKEIAEKAKEILAKEGIDLEIKEFDDYVTPNTSLQEKDIDLNFYQHIPYLDNFNKERGTKLVSLGAVHLEPMGIYSKKYKSLDELKDGDEVIIPNDATNGARALKILEDNKVIKLKENAGLEATEKDIAENPKNLKFTAVEAATIPRAYEDAAIAVINSNFALEAKLSPKKDAIAIEKSEGNPFANIIAAREEDKDNETYKKVLQAFQSDEVRKYIEEKFDGEIIPAK